MGELIMSGPVADLIRANKIDEADVRELRRTTYRDGVVNSQEATAILALDRSCQIKCPQWAEFYVEALGDYIVYQTEPRGHVSEANAEGLIRAISVDGIVDTSTELELLLHVLRKAKSVPSKLSAFALKQVANAVLKGRGVLAANRAGSAGVVTAADVSMLRDVLYSVATGDNVAISRDEADVLFDINDATAMAANDPSWQVLFSKAVAASIMMLSNLNAPEADLLTTRKLWIDDNQVDVMSFLRKGFSGGLSAFADKVMSANSVEAEAADRLAAQQEALSIAEAIDTEEAQWLAERIGRDGRLHDNEKELLQFIAREVRNIPQSLQPLMTKVA